MNFKSKTKNSTSVLIRSNIQVFPYGEAPKPKGKKKSNSERKELQNLEKLISVIEDRPLFAPADLNKYQLSEYSALVSPNEADVVPNMKSNKSKAVTDYLGKMVPTAFSSEKPVSVDFLIVEGENLIAKGPGIKKTIKYVYFQFITFL